MEYPSASVSNTRWTCTVCDRQMQNSDKQSHLNGKGHAAQLAAPNASTSVSDTLWTCTVCNRQMKQSDKQSHLNGKGHAAQLAAPNASTSVSDTLWTCTVCDRQMKQSDKQSHLNGKGHAAQIAAPNASTSVSDSLWTCTVCNCQMQNSDKQSHLNGKGHAAQLAAPNASTSVRDTLWTCTVCNCQMQQSNKQSHLDGKRHTKLAHPKAVENDQKEKHLCDTAVTSAASDGDTWTCTVCDRQMKQSDKQSHLTGKAHAALLADPNASGPPLKKKEKPIKLHPNGKEYIKIHEVLKVYGDVCHIPLHCYEDAWKGRNTLVTAEEVEEASNRFDGESLLYDIDTQWGMIPQGGAYKDSNRYYGSGMYDYY